MAVNLRTLEYTIPESFRGETVGAFLRSLGYSRHIIYHLRNTSAIHPETGESIFGMLLNGSKTWAKCILSDGDRLKINILETEISEHVEESCIPLNIIYEDDNILVLDKPAGMLTHPHGDFTIEPTLEDYGLICHRLDRATSGVIILAKNLEAKRKVMKQFQDRKAHKTYVAITDGCPKNPEALIDLPIARNLKKHNTFYVSKQGRPSQTHYRVIKHNQRYAMLELKPTTGRTHQLRVHMAHLGCPVAGDGLYGTALPALPGRFALHSARLAFTHPLTGAHIALESPLPEELAGLMGQRQGP